jgi:hypothetical protein
MLFLFAPMHVMDYGFIFRAGVVSSVLDLDIHACVLTPKARQNVEASPIRVVMDLDFLHCTTDEPSGLS